MILNEIIGLAWWISRLKKMPKIGLASGPKYVPAHININDINWFGRWISRPKKNAENWTSIGAEICTGKCQYK